MMGAVTEKLRQRADYTHKFNARTGRHGWLRLTPAYSVKIVDELMASYRGPLRVLDPFCGTATTALSAACHGHTGVTTDINPFLVWFGRAKTAKYSDTTIASTREAGSMVLALGEPAGSRTGTGAANSRRRQMVAAGRVGVSVSIEGGDRCRNRACLAGT